jgi:hypothetical protein
MISYRIDLPARRSSYSPERFQIFCHATPTSEVLSEKDDTIDFCSPDSTNHIAEIVHKIPHHPTILWPIAVVLSFARDARRAEQCKKRSSLGKKPKIPHHPTILYPIAVVLSFAIEAKSGEVQEEDFLRKEAHDDVFYGIEKQW